MRLRWALPTMLMLSACTTIAPGDIPSRAASYESTLPPMKRFSTSTPSPSAKSNSEIARDFIDLSFRLESGRSLPQFSRFEGPVSVRVTGQPPASLERDLASLLERLRNEAGIDITHMRGEAQANITIEAVPRDDIRRLLPQAACFVVPNVTSFAEYRQARRATRVNWAPITRRTRVAIFVPNDSSPQEVRDCLHEELAQALGPLNDLYRLPDSVFNDDNVHTVLTGFDMVILRATYDPALRPGMSQQEIARRLPGVLARINPDGRLRGTRPIEATPRSWIAAVQAALGPDTRLRERRRAAREAVEISMARGWQDHRRGFAHYVEGRILQVSDPDGARRAFEAARSALIGAPATALHQAYVASQLAAYALAENDPAEVLALVTPAQAVAMRHENAALLATLMLLRAEALELSGRASEAHIVRMDSLGWARYGFGADWAVRAKMREIARLSPLERG